MYSNQEIEKLLPLGGGWAIRVYFEELIARKIANQSLSFLDVNTVIANSCGVSAINIIDKIANITGRKLPKIPAHLHNSEYTGNLPIVEDKSNLPDELTKEYWIDQLCKFFDTNALSLDKHIQKLKAADKQTDINSYQIIRDWSFPKLRTLHNIKNGGQFNVKCIVDELAQLCWRRWYWEDNFKNLYLIYPQNRFAFGNNQWLMFSMVHDAAHLLHLTEYPHTCQPSNPNNLAFMEGFAMFSEFRFFELFNQSYEVEEDLGTAFDTRTARMFNLLGLLERSFRIDYDYDVHLLGCSPQTWIERTCKKYNLNSSYFQFAYEFHGLPGLASSYMLGLWSYKKSNNVEDTLAKGSAHYADLLKLVAEGD